MNEILIVVDVQNDFVTGSLGSPQAQEAMPFIVKTVERFSRSGIPIIFTQDTHYSATYHLTQEGKLLPVEHCICGTEGYKICEEVFRALNNGCSDYFYARKSGFGYYRLGRSLPDVYGIRGLQIRRDLYNRFLHGYLRNNKCPGIEDTVSKYQDSRVERRMRRHDRSKA